MEDSSVLVLRFVPLGTLRRKIWDNLVKEQAYMFCDYDARGRVRMRMGYEAGPS
jgi:hypothetical protein